MQFGSCVPCGGSLFNQDIHHVAVLCVEADQCAVVGWPHHSPVNSAIVHHHGSQVGQEHIEAGNALPDHIVQLQQAALWQVRDNHGETVIDSGPALGPLLYREVHNAGGASNGDGDCAGSKVVGGDRSAEREIQVSVRIDASGY